MQSLCFCFEHTVKTKDKVLQAYAAWLVLISDRASVNLSILFNCGGFYCLQYPGWDKSFPNYEKHEYGCWQRSSEL